MVYEFKNKDIGKRVSLSLDVQRLDNYFEEEEGFKNIPYDAITNHQFLIKVGDKPKRRIVNSGPTQRKISLSSIIAGLGVDNMIISGDIVEVKDSYLKIREYKKNNFP